VIELDGVSVSFGDVSVLDGVDLGIDRGEFVALVGPNGAGKTTLLRTVNGILDPDDGSVSIDDEPVGSLSAREISHKVATVPQDTHVGFAFTAEQVVEMGRTPHRSRLDWSDDADPVDGALERTETEQLRDRAIDELSGGERQRVLLARALAQEPSALLLDEPTASLDINHQIRVLDLVADLVDEGRAALAAIHDLDLAARFCDRLLLLYDGAIGAAGPPETVLRDPGLGEAFGTTPAVTRNPVTGTPTVAAVSDRPDRGTRVHVAGGGESGVAAVRTLWRAGYDLSVGPVPEGDVAASLAAQLGLETVTAPAFDVPDGVTRETAREAARTADVVVYTDGPGSDALQGAIDADARIHAALGADTPGIARGDGGQLTVVEGDGALLTAVEERRG
jgi:iron complex transport system ATP-binding protein